MISAPKVIGHSPSRTEAFVDDANSDDDRLSVLYIDGTARSGSTILARMVGAQSHFMTVGEACLIWRFGVTGNGRCSCGDEFSSCSFWNDVADCAPGIFDIETAQRYVAFLNTTVLQSRRLPHLWTARGRSRIVDQLPEGFLDDLSRLYRAIRTVSGAEVIVDGSKFPAYGFLLCLVPDINVTIVQLIRDPRAVAFSWQRRKVTNASRETDESQYFHKRAASVAALDWVLQNLSIDIIDSLGDRGYRLHYEDFIARPDAITDEFMGIMGVAGDSVGRSDDRVINLPAVHIFGNPNRFDAGGVRIQLDDEWQRNMASGSRLLVTAITWPLLVTYGYPLRAFAPTRATLRQRN